MKLESGILNELTRKTNCFTWRKGPHAHPSLVSSCTGKIPASTNTAPQGSHGDVRPQFQRCAALWFGLGWFGPHIKETLLRTCGAPYSKHMLRSINYTKLRGRIAIYVLVHEQGKVKVRQTIYLGWRSKVTLRITPSPSTAPSQCPMQQCGLLLLVCCPRRLPRSATTAENLTRMTPWDLDRHSTTACPSKYPQKICQCPPLPS